MAGGRRWWALGAVQLAVLAVGLDITVLSVALPTLAKALPASESDLQWFSSGYALVLAAAMLPAGLLGDRYGRKRTLLVALALFGAGSAACAYAPSANAFLVARLALGLAGAGVIVMAISAVIVLFSEEERPRAVAIWAAANFLAMPIGPILGGWLLSHYWWGWVFLINLPVAAIGFAAVSWLVPESRSPERPARAPVGNRAGSPPARSCRWPRGSRLSSASSPGSDGSACARAASRCSICRSLALCPSPGARSLSRSAPWP
jgi:DHA2 family multidrug resistance protein-like MFS transporter